MRYRDFFFFFLSVFKTRYWDTIRSNGVLGYTLKKGLTILALLRSRKLYGHTWLNPCRLFENWMPNQGVYKYWTRIRPNALQLFPGLLLHFLGDVPLLIFAFTLGTRSFLRRQSNDKSPGNKFHQQSLALPSPFQAHAHTHTTHAHRLPTFFFFSILMPTRQTLREVPPFSAP